MIEAQTPLHTVWGTKKRALFHKRAREALILHPLDDSPLSPVRVKLNEDAVPDENTDSIVPHATSQVGEKFRATAIKRYAKQRIRKRLGNGSSHRCFPLVS